jgi:diaminopimelate decarboxylase
MDPRAWNLERRDGRLWMDGRDFVALADEYGTPLHVTSATTLRRRARELLGGFAGYPAPVTAHYSYKTNPLAAVARILHEEGIGAEVVSGYELWMAGRVGVPPERVVVNGPNKSFGTLAEAVAAGVGLVVVDGPYEIEPLERAAVSAGARVSVALRVRPDVVPRGMNVSSATGSHRSQFGMDPGSEEFAQALRRAVASPHLRVRGAMAHIGSGIHDMVAFRRMIGRLLDAQEAIAQAGGEADLLDVGGGLGTRLSGEFGRLEMLAYLAFGRLPRPGRVAPEGLISRYGATIAASVLRECRARGLDPPALVLEPGRALVSDAQVLLLRVGAVRERRRGAPVALVDGGAMTVSMMFLSERHAVLLANRDAPEAGRTSIFGRLPSPMDVVYRNLPMPRLRAGDLLAVMDAGAYFTSTETCFGGMRPAVLLLREGAVEVARRRETPADRATTQPLLCPDGTGASGERTKDPEQAGRR